MTPSPESALLGPSTDRERLHFLIGAQFGVTYTAVDRGEITLTQGVVTFVCASLLAWGVFRFAGYAKARWFGAP